LSRRVPKVQDNDLILYVHLLGHEINADGGLVGFIEGVIDKSVDDGGFSDGLVSEKHDFVFVLANAT